jgi:two-component system cell cycle sensor histidine kinase PleC
MPGGIAFMVLVTSFLASTDRSLQAAQVRTLRETMWLHAGGCVVWAFVLAWAFSTESMGPLSFSTIVCWHALMFAWGVLAFAALATRLRRVESEAEHARADRLLIALYSLNSVLWVLLPLMLWVPGNPHNNYFVLIIIVANTLFVFQIAIHRTIFLIMLAPGLLALWATLLLDGSSFLVPYMVMTPAFLIWAGGLGLQLNDQILQAVRTGLNNRALADDLGDARDEALRQKAAADAANASKSNFLATMSHELRTPLNAIIGFSQIIRLQMLGRESDKYASYAGDIEDSGKHLLGLINQILDLAKIEAGTMALSPSDFDLAAVVDECARSMRIRAEDKGMTLSVTRQHVRIMVRADEMAVRQIVLNLVANAVKFTSKGSITIALDVQNEVVELAVSDTGCGIDSAHLTRIFQPFEQVDNSLSREHGGTGLGLPIVAKLAEAHNGAFSVESTPGVGSRFAVRLPIVKDVLQSAA